jgi:hypothetical protein
MTDLNRREMLKKGLLITGAAATVAASQEMVLADGDMCINFEDEMAARAAEPQQPSLLEQEVAELIKYATELHKVRKQHDLGDAAGISVPRAVLPLSMYSGRHEALRTIPEPNIPFTHSCMVELPCMTALNTICRAYIEQARLRPKFIEIVPKLTLIHPCATQVMADRIVSPHYVVDVEEPWFNMRTTAMFLLDAAHGIIDEQQQKIRTALRMSREIKALGSRELRMQMTPVKTYVKREAYLLEFFAWSNATGYIASKTQLTPPTPETTMKLTLSKAV